MISRRKFLKALSLVPVAGLLVGNSKAGEVANNEAGSVLATWEFEDRSVAVSYSDIFAEALRRNRPRLMDNIKANNALLSRMRNKQLKDKLFS